MQERIFEITKQVLLLIFKHLLFILLKTFLNEEFLIYNNVFG